MLKPSHEISLWEEGEKRKKGPTRSMMGSVFGWHAAQFHPLCLLESPLPFFSFLPLQQQQQNQQGTSSLSSS